MKKILTGITLAGVMLCAVSGYAQKTSAVPRDSVALGNQRKSLDSLWDQKKSRTKHEAQRVASSLSKDSLQFDSLSFKHTVGNSKKSLDSLWSEKKSKSKQHVQNVASTTKNEVANKPAKLKSDGEKLLEGDGLTNENAKEKLTNFAKDTKVSDADFKKKASDVIGDQDLSVDKAKETVAKIADNPEGKLGTVLNGADINDPLGSVTKIFSDKEIKFAYDSLLTKVDWNVVNAMLQDPNAVSDGSIVEAVFVKFPGLKGVSKTKQDATLLMGLQNGVNPTQTLASLAAVHLHDLQNMKVSDSTLSQLPPLRGSKLDSTYTKYAQKYWAALDSMRKANLKLDGLKLEEKQLSDLSKESVIKKKLGFLDKFYFEGIVGLLNGGWNGNLNIIQLSPSLGYHLVRNVSLGFGPSVVLQTQSKRITSTWGLRSFLKYELLKYNLYLQAEDNLSFPQVDKKSIDEEKTTTVHAFMIGGGYLLPLTKRIALNLNMMYRVAGKNSIGINGSSPFVYRIGISSTRDKTKLK